MTEKKIDEFFKDKLQQHASQVPDDMWQRITEKKDKDRKIFFIPRWYYIGAALLMATLITAIYIIQPPTKNTNNGNYEQVTGKKKDITTSNSLKLVNTDTVTVSAEKDNTEIINKNDYTKENINATILQKDKINFKKNKNVTNQNIYNSKNRYSTLSQNNHLNIDNTLSVNENKKEDKAVNNNAFISKEQQNKSTARQKDFLKDTLNNAPIEDAREDSLPEPKNHLSLEAYISPDIPFGKISSSNTTYAEERNAASKMKLSYTVGARLSGPLGKHYLWKIGFQYAVINESYNSLDSLDSYGSVIHNHYKSLDIPLLIGYKTGDKKLNFSVTTGILLNVTSKYSGKISDAFLSNTDISKAYKSNTGISLFLGASMSTALKDKIELFAEPYFKYRLNNIAQTQQPFSQKINTLGLSLGVRYQLFKKLPGN